MNSLGIYYLDTNVHNHLYERFAEGSQAATEVVELCGRGVVGIAVSDIVLEELLAIFRTDPVGATRKFDFLRRVTHNLTLLLKPHEQIVIEEIRAADGGDPPPSPFAPAAA